MDTTVRVHGARELRARLKRAGQSLDDLKEANSRVASFVAAVSSVRAPRRTGRLAGRLKGNRAAGRAVVSAPGLVYGPPVHWGWEARGIEPQPFVSEAAQDTEPTWLREYERDVERVVDSLGGP